MTPNTEDRINNHSVFIGVVPSHLADTINLAILDENQESLSFQSFDILPLTKEDVLFLRGKKGEHFDFGEDFNQIKRFIELHCRDASVIQVLLAVPEIYPDPGFPKHLAPPFSIFDTQSILLKLSFLLAQLGLIVFTRTVLPNSRIALRPFPAEGERSNLWQRQPFYLTEDVLIACSELLTNKQPSLTQVAGVGALLAKWTSAYSYWSSFGRVQSSQDLVEFMRSSQSRTYVSSASESYGIRKSPRKTYLNTPQIPLEFALVMQHHKNLPEHDALKVALAHVCKLVGITLTCHSQRIGAEKAEYTQVWPPPKDYSWALDKIVSITQ